LEQIDIAKGHYSLPRIKTHIIIKVFDILVVRGSNTLKPDIKG